MALHLKKVPNAPQKFEVFQQSFRSLSTCAWVHFCEGVMWITRRDYTSSGFKSWMNWRLPETCTSVCPLEKRWTSWGKWRWFWRLRRRWSCDWHRSRSLLAWRARNGFRTLSSWGSPRRAAKDSSGSEGSPLSTCWGRYPPQTGTWKKSSTNLVFDWNYPCWLEVYRGGVGRVVIAKEHNVSF